MGTLVVTSGLRSLGSGGIAPAFLSLVHPEQDHVFSGNDDAVVGPTSARHGTHQFPFGGFHLPICGKDLRCVHSADAVLSVKPEEVRSNFQADCQRIGITSSEPSQEPVSSMPIASVPGFGPTPLAQCVKWDYVSDPPGITATESQGAPGRYAFDRPRAARFYKLSVNRLAQG